MRNYKLLTLILLLFFSSCGVKKVSYRDKNPKKIKNKSVKALTVFSILCLMKKEHIGM
jgi:uncharacterized membrane protein